MKQNNAQINNTLIVFSIDYDGCVGMPGCINNTWHVQLCNYMIQLLNQYPTSSLVLMVGSTRQSGALNQSNMNTNRNGSCYKFMNILLLWFRREYPAYASRVELNKLLLEDIEYKTLPGTSFDLDWLYPAEHTRSIPWQDDSKITLLYTQMHYIAMTYSKKSIVFCFFDDMKNILETLRGYKFRYCGFWS